MCRFHVQFTLALNLILSIFLAGEITQNASAATKSPKTPPAKASAATPPATPTPPQTPSPSCARYTKSVQLYFIRDLTTITPILESIKKTNTLDDLTIGGNNNRVILSGCKKNINAMSRAIATLDLPRSSINLEMWGIKLSSSNPDKLGTVISEVNQEIAKTKQLMQQTYAALEIVAVKIKVEPELNKLFSVLGYNSALDTNRNLSMTDILIRINAAQDPQSNAVAIAKNIKSIFNKPEYKDYRNFVQQPFERFLAARGVDKDQCVDPQSDACKIQKEKVDLNTLRGRQALLNFALNYSDYVSNPTDFDSENLQQAAENLDARIKPVVEAINLDVADLFIEPTLNKIQAIVRKHKDVEYAQVGKTSVSSLDGTKAEVSTETLSTFKEVTPINLREFLKTADLINGKVPTISQLGDLVLTASQTKSFTVGDTVVITPNVLRNSTSAELNVDMTFAPPVAGTSEESDTIKPLSRVSKHIVKTSVYVNTLDIFAISTFNNQITKDGGRSYVPVVGTIWQGVFGSIPVVGDLFSWKNPPQNILHQSIILTNSFIIPTSMGLGILYQPKTEINQYDNCIEVQNYLRQKESELASIISDKSLADGKCIGFKKPRS